MFCPTLRGLRCVLPHTARTVLCSAPHCEDCAVFCPTLRGLRCVLPHTARTAPQPQHDAARVCVNGQCVRVELCNQEALQRCDCATGLSPHHRCGEPDIRLCATRRTGVLQTARSRHTGGPNRTRPISSSEMQVGSRDGVRSRGVALSPPRGQKRRLGSVSTCSPEVSLARLQCEWREGPERLTSEWKGCEGEGVHMRSFKFHSSWVHCSFPLRLRKLSRQKMTFSK